MRKILIVDDEEKIREVLVSYLEKEGYATLEAANGTEALKLFNEEAPDLVILDLMLPDVSGETVCQRIRGQSPVPILMLTAKISEGSRIEGFALGADDYVIKPFSPREVVARLKAILRRSHQDLLASRISYRDGELMIDTDRKEVLIRGEAVSLTPAEFKLLLILARHPDRSFSREELIEKAFGVGLCLGGVRNDLFVCCHIHHGHALSFVLVFKRDSVAQSASDQFKPSLRTGLDSIDCVDVGGHDHLGRSDQFLCRPKDCCPFD
ncbi:response regulator transcription factor [Laceyella sacchari]|uniref:Response regulator transcription factor n=1 Tax=Laceyella sacchari TaxID=37482 RepID=A0ABY5U3V7_LACSH|nr:response regulator transcription factor [Laceyella sacchari]UWE04253.1 response regulator transcription factor [Laceyella sacchari]